MHAVIEGMLICLAPALCASHCDVCDEWVGLGNATAEAVLRETELRLHTSIRQQSRSVLDCVASFECLAEVAAEVAKRLGSADTLPPTVRMEKVAKANLALLEGARAEAKQNENASWQVRRPARFALLREHVAAALAHEQTPLGEDDAVAESGRRLAERPPPSPPPLTPIQEMMKVATNETCRQLALKNSTGAHDAHVQSTHLWMVRPLLNPPPKNAHARLADTRVCPFLVFGRRRQRPARPGPDLRRLRLRPVHHLVPPAHGARGPRADQDAPRRREAARDPLRREEAPHGGEGAVAHGRDVLRRQARRHGGVRGQVLPRPRQAHLGQARDARGAQDDRGRTTRRPWSTSTSPRRRLAPAHRAQRPAHTRGHSTDAWPACAHQVGIDVVNPDLHPDPACRVSNHSTDLAKMECMGKSILHHAAKLHGYDAETLQSKLDELNLDVGEGLMAMAKTFGYAREGRGPVKSAFFEKQAKDEASASVLMRESRARMEAKRAEGRRLAEAETGAGAEAEDRESGFGGGHGLGQHAMHAGGMRKQLQNASGVMHRGMMAIERAATRANNVQSRGSGPRERPPHPDDLDWHAAKSSVPNPLVALLAVSAEEGSMASRFGNGIVKLNALRDRASGALSTTRRRLQEHDAVARRRLHANVAHADALYEALERSHAASPPKRQALELPERHALSWVHVRLAFAPLEHAHAHAHAHAPSAHIRALFRSSSTGTASSTRARGCTASRARGTSCARRARRTPRSSGSTRRGTTTSTTRTTRAPRSRATRCAACCTARRRAPTRRGTSRACWAACAGA